MVRLADPAAGVVMGLSYAVLSGVCNGLFTAPMKLIRGWRWENIWLVFILVACVVMPALIVFSATGMPGAVFALSPSPAVAAALAFGFAWGFGAILFGLSVDRLGVSLANSMVIGLSSAMGSLVPLLLRGSFRVELPQMVLMAGVATFIAGVALCGSAGRLREKTASAGRSSGAGYVFAIVAGIMSAVFNIGYSLALPIADAGVALGLSRFDATNTIWLLMLEAGAIPNICYCGFMMARHRSGALFLAAPVGKSWGLGALTGVLWGASIFLYGAATPRLGDIGPSIGWPLSLAVGLLVANLMGALLGEWKSVEPRAVRKMRAGVLTILAAVVLCALAAAAGR